MKVKAYRLLPYIKLNLSVREEHDIERGSIVRATVGGYTGDYRVLDTPSPQSGAWYSYPPGKRNDKLVVHTKKPFMQEFATLDTYTSSDCDGKAYLEHYLTICDKENYVFVTDAKWRKLGKLDNLYIRGEEFDVLVETATKRLGKVNVPDLMPDEEGFYFPPAAWEHLKEILYEPDLKDGDKIEVSEEEETVPTCLICKKQSLKGVGNAEGRVGYLKWFGDWKEKNKGNLTNVLSIHYDYALVCGNKNCNAIYPTIKDEHGKHRKHTKKRIKPARGATCPLCGCLVEIIGQKELNVDVGNVYTLDLKKEKPEKTILSNLYYNFIGICKNTDNCGYVFPLYKFEKVAEVKKTHVNIKCAICRQESKAKLVPYLSGDVGDLKFRGNTGDIPHNLDILFDYSISCGNEECWALYPTYLKEKDGEATQPHFKKALAIDHTCPICAGKKEFKLALVPHIDVGNVNPKGSENWVHEKKIADIFYKGGWICTRCHAVFPVEASTIAEPIIDIDLKQASTYLVEERTVSRSAKLFANLINEGEYNVVGFSRKKPTQLAQEHGFSLENCNLYWLTDKETEYPLTTSYQLERFEAAVIDQITQNKKSAIFLFNPEYLIDNNSFEAFLRLYRRLVDEVSETKSVFIVSVSNETLGQQNYKLLERAATDVI